MQVTFGVERATYRTHEGIARWIEEGLLADDEVGQYQGGDLSKQR